MTYCGKCGREVEEGRTLCDSCEQALSNAAIETPPKKKKSKKPLVFILVAFLILCLLGFGGWFGYRTFFQSPIDKLNDDERLVYDALIVNINDFYDQASLRVLECGEPLYGKDDEQTNLFFSDDEYGCYIKISSKNRMGGTVSDVYCLILSGEDMGQIWKSSGLKTYSGEIYEDEYEIVTQSEKIDTSKLNAALKEYCTSMGLS